MLHISAHQKLSGSNDLELRHSYSTHIRLLSHCTSHASYSRLTVWEGSFSRQHYHGVEHSTAPESVMGFYTSTAKEVLLVVVMVVTVVVVVVIVVVVEQ